MRLIFIIILVLSGCKTTNNNSILVSKQKIINVPFGYNLIQLSQKEENRLQLVNSEFQITLKNPHFLFDINARKSYLNKKKLGEICKHRYKIFDYSEKITPYRYLKDPNELRKSSYSEILIHKIIMGSSHFFGSYDKILEGGIDAGEHTLRVLEAYAKKNYPSMDQKKRYGHTIGSSAQFFHSSAWAMQLLADHPNLTKERKSLIDNWLKNKTLGKHIKFKKNGSWFNGHDGVKQEPIKIKVSGISNINCCTPMGYESTRLQVDNALMANSILYNDLDGFKSSLKGFIDVIDTMRFDGSLPYQTSRGNAAIWYQNLGINVLIATAEMAKYQGIDLYSFKSKSGGTIHDAVTFLLNSVQNKDLIYKYASRNLNPWRKGKGITDPLDYKFQLGTDKIFKWQRGSHKASFLAWYEIYKYNFPNHPNLENLNELANNAKNRLYNSIELPHKPPSPLFNDYSGMSTSCLYYKE
jgi:hypothetical protein